MGDSQFLNTGNLTVFGYSSKSNNISIRFYNIVPDM